MKHRSWRGEQPSNRPRADLRMASRSEPRSRQDPKPADWLAERTGVPALTLPFTVGGDAQSKDLFSFYDSTIDKLLGAIK